MDIEIVFDGNKKINAKVKDQIIRTDQPVSDGGDGTAASPFDLFMASMGTCVGYYVKAFCDNRKISTEKIKIKQTSDYNKETHLVENIQIEIELPEDFPIEHKEHLLRAAGKCKVKKHLETPPKVIVEYKNN
jgi:putative redox protein